MRTIYERAHKVVFWLGPEMGESTLALKFIEFMAEQAAKPSFPAWVMESAKGRHYQREWRALQHLFERSWWTRTWAVQEFILAKEVDFICGPRTMAATNLEVALGQVSHYGFPVSKLLNEQHAIEINLLAIRNIITLITFRHWRRGGKTMPLLPILNAINWTSCSDSRDKVYGILGIANDPGAARISPDYNVTTREVYKRLVICHIESTRTPDILGLVKPLNSIEGLPS
jgi:hypothetical protein